MYAGNVITHIYRRDAMNNKKQMDRKKFLKFILLGLIPVFFHNRLFGLMKQKKIADWIIGENYDPYDHYWGMGIDINKCIGCGSCVKACKNENEVSPEPFFFRTWVERYNVYKNGEVMVDSPNGAIDGFHKIETDGKAIRNFFVPKLCNHCDEPPCVQVCPVGATFKSVDGVILVDQNYCLGCGYCIQACPYGARYMNPESKTADKCTFCYHRLVKGKLPACVEVCPTQSRIFGETKKKPSPLLRFLRMNTIGILKPSLNTEPKVLYANLDMEVK